MGKGDINRWKGDNGLKVHVGGKITRLAENVALGVREGLGLPGGWEKTAEGPTEGEKTNIIYYIICVEPHKTGIDDLLYKADKEKNRISLQTCSIGLPRWLSGKESSSSVGDLGSMAGLGRSPREGKGYPL